MKIKTLKHLASIPFIWLPLVSTVLSHLLVGMYQFICFPFYGLEKVKLRNYVSFDREKLSYLSFIDKINCAYCSYSNGVFGWMAEIGHRTEFYWCGVKHENQPDNPAFAYQEKFAAYGSEEDYERVCRLNGRTHAQQID